MSSKVTQNLVRLPSLILLAILQDIKDRQTKKNKQIEDKLAQEEIVFHETLKKNVQKTMLQLNDFQMRNDMKKYVKNFISPRGNANEITFKVYEEILKFANFDIENPCTRQLLGISNKDVHMPSFKGHAIAYLARGVTGQNNKQVSSFDFNYDSATSVTINEEQYFRTNQGVLLFKNAYEEIVSMEKKDFIFSHDGERLFLCSEIDSQYTKLFTTKNTDDENALVELFTFVNTHLGKEVEGRIKELSECSRMKFAPLDQVLMNCVYDRQYGTLKVTYDDIDYSFKAMPYQRY